MELLISKTVAFMLSPFSLVIICFFGSILFWLAGARKISKCLNIGGVFVILVCSSPVLARQLVQFLESQYPPVAISDVPQSPLIVVLGGVLAQPAYPRLQSELVESSDRILHAFRLFKAGKAPLIFLSAGNLNGNPDEASEADYISALLQEWGVPEQAIRIGSGSRTTRENALETREFMRSNNLESETVLLITSAKHMPRAAKTFEKIGISIFPCTTDVSAGASPFRKYTGWMPSLGALRSFSTSWHEILGIWVYRWRGWI